MSDKTKILSKSNSMSTDNSSHNNSDGNETVMENNTKCTMNMKNNEHSKFESNSSQQVSKKYQNTVQLKCTIYHELEGMLVIGLSYNDKKFIGTLLDTDKYKYSAPIRSNPGKNSQSNNSSVNSSSACYGNTSLKSNKNNKNSNHSTHSSSKKRSHLSNSNSLNEKDRERDRDRDRERDRDRDRDSCDAELIKINEDSLKTLIYDSNSNNNSDFDNSEKSNHSNSNSNSKIKENGRSSKNRALRSQTNTPLGSLGSNSKPFERKTRRSLAARETGIEIANQEKERLAERQRRASLSRSKCGTPTNVTNVSNVTNVASNEAMPHVNPDPQPGKKENGDKDKSHSMHSDASESTPASEANQLSRTKSRSLIRKISTDSINNSSQEPPAKSSKISRDQTSKKEKCNSKKRKEKMSEELTMGAESDPTATSQNQSQMPALIRAPGEDKYSLPGYPNPRGVMFHSPSKSNSTDCKSTHSNTGTSANTISHEGKLPVGSSSSITSTVTTGPNHPTQSTTIPPPPKLVERPNHNLPSNLTIPTAIKPDVSSHAKKVGRHLMHTGSSSSLVGSGGNFLNIQGSAFSDSGGKGFLGCF